MKLKLKERGISQCLLKVFFVMRITLFFILLGSMFAFSANSYSQNTKLSMRLNNATVSEVLKAIEGQSEFMFFYQDQQIDLNRQVNISVVDKSVNEILDQLFRESDNVYKISDRQIIIGKSEKQLKIKGFPIERIFDEQQQQPQNKQLKGKVSDNKGVGIPGTSVVVKGTKIATIADSDGNFTLDVPLDSKTLLFSFIGMKPQEIQIGNKTNFVVVLEEQIYGYDEVVVVGYGVQKKQSVVGAITQASNEQLKRSGNVSDLKQALTGLLPGVTTITSSGEPGGTGNGQSATSIFIRGQNTWNGGQPLILVDGVERSMNNLDVSEVENISVLKDASATAVFGVKGANGVILITTKRGSTGKPELSFSYNATALMISKLPQKLDSYNTLLIKNEAIEREVVLNEPSWADYMPTQIVERYKLPQSAEYAQIYPNVNWTDAMFKDFSISHRAALNVQGGTNFVSYFGSLTYLHEGDMFRDYDNHAGYDPNYNFDRFNFRSNLDFKVTNTTNLKVNLSGYFSQKNTNGSFQSVNSGTNPLAWSSAYFMPPDVCLPQYPDGRWGASFKLPAEQLQNPVALIYNTGIVEMRSTQLNADFALEQKLDFITKGLSAKALLFYDNSIQTTGGINAGNAVRAESGSSTPQKVVDADLYTGPNQNPSEYTQNVPASGSYLFDWSPTPWTVAQEAVSAPSYLGYVPIERRLMYQFQANYSRKFDKHNVGAMGLFKREEYARGSMFKNYREDWVFRATYDYDSRYLLEMNGAYNGSEQFGPGYRFDFFPSVAAAWNISQEKFFKIDWINKLKLRYSVGMVGDDKGSGGRWLYTSQYSYGGYSQLSQNPNAVSPYRWYKESVVGNPDIHWEKARKENYGLELGLLDNMISLNYDYFTENRTDIMLAGGSRSSIPPYFGANPPSANVGIVKSNGHEIELKLVKLMNNGFRYWANIALTHTKNKVLAKDDPALLASYLQAKGYPIGQTRTLIRSGFYNNWDDIYASIPMETNDASKLPGYYNLLDFNADGVIKATDDSAPFGYSEVPENSYNFSLGAEYKGFSLMFQFYGVNNVSRYIPLRTFNLYQDVLFDHVLDYWSKDNQDASSFLPRWKTTGQNIGDYFVFDGSYLRLKTAELAYTFQNKLVKKMGLTALRIYLNGNNLYFWSKLPDDRESAWSGGAASDGAYPTPKRINMGVDLTF